METTISRTSSRLVVSSTTKLGEAIPAGISATNNARDKKNLSFFFSLVFNTTSTPTLPSASSHKTIQKSQFTSKVTQTTIPEILNRSSSSSSSISSLSSYSLSSFGSSSSFSPSSSPSSSLSSFPSSTFGSSSSPYFSFPSSRSYPSSPRPPSPRSSSFPSSSSPSSSSFPSSSFPSSSSPSSFGSPSFPYSSLSPSSSSFPSSNQTGHESTTSHTSSANDTPVPAISPAGLSSMRGSGSTEATLSPVQTITKDTWDESVLVAASLFILALSLVAVALRILCPIYHRIMGHNASKAPRGRHSSGRHTHRPSRRQIHRNTDPYEIIGCMPSTSSEDVPTPFGTPATYLRPMMNYEYPHPYQYPLTYMPYSSSGPWPAQVYEQDYMNPLAQTEVPPPPAQKASTSHQADRLVEILEYSSNQLNMGALYRHNWDQLFDPIANESMLSYVGHPSECRSIPVNPKMQH